MIKNQAFVVSYQVNIDGDEPDNFPDEIAQISNSNESMRIFISTKHLLSLSSKHVKLLHADATYKLFGSVNRY